MSKQKHRNSQFAHQANGTAFITRSSETRQKASIQVVIAHSDLTDPEVRFWERNLHLGCVAKLDVGKEMASRGVMDEKGVRTTKPCTNPRLTVFRLHQGAAGF